MPRPQGCHVPHCVSVALTDEQFAAIGSPVRFLLGRSVQFGERVRSRKTMTACRTTRETVAPLLFASSSQRTTMSAEGSLKSQRQRKARFERLR